MSTSFTRSVVGFGSVAPGNQVRRSRHDDLGQRSPRDYPELRRRAEVLRVGEHDVLVANVDDLIAMKRTTGRRSDASRLLESEELKVLQERTREAGDGEER